MQTLQQRVKEGAAEPRVGLEPRPIVFHRYVQPIDAIKRRAAMGQINMAARYYGLRQAIDAFIGQCERESLGDLSDQQLNDLSKWVHDVVECMSVAADPPDMPPAR